ncbi:MAG: Alx protein, partial [Proteobacteria bacterium]|nr:Alx protein [Pseudomonadota bacterium]
ADRFSLLKYGLALVLMFIGVKMMLVDLLTIPVWISLAAVAAIIGISVWLSFRRESSASADKANTTSAEL